MKLRSDTTRRVGVCRDWCEPQTIRPKLKGQALSFIVTVIFIFIIAAIMFAILIMSVTRGTSHIQQTIVLTSTEQPLSIASGLLQQRLLDGRTLIDESLHALGGASILMPPLASRALQLWGIENWHITVAGRRLIEFGTDIMTNCVSGNRLGLCATTCPTGSMTLPSVQCATGEFCCVEDYDWTSKRYNYNSLSGMPECGPDNGYYGVCEPGGCSLGRNDVGVINCPEFPIGSHCCRPFTDSEKIMIAGITTDDVTIPLLYPGMSGNLTIGTNQLQ